MGLAAMHPAQMLAQVMLAIPVMENVRVPQVMRDLIATRVSSILHVIW